ncbi:MAG: hypothetical protein H0U75_04375 [Legionella sp.]|nr:hypothetical protein [Legionella sp.]
MLILSILLFALAAILGLYLLSFILKDKNTPKGVAFTHGPLAALALILLIIYACLSRPAPIVSIIIFILATMGGTMLMFKDITGKPIPKWLAIGHGITAIIGFIFLLMFALNS